MADTAGAMKKQSTKTQNKNATGAAAALVSNATVAQVTQGRAWSRVAVMSKLQMRGLDGACCWLGSEISDSFCNRLSEAAAKLGAVKLGDKLGSVLVVDARRVFGWRVAVAGDVYGRRDGILNVRGSLALLRSIYGERNVAVFSTVEAAAKFAKGKKWDKGCADALGIATKAGE